MRRFVISNLLGGVGAVAGGAIGLLIFLKLHSRGIIAPFVPGVMVGLGASALSWHRSSWRGLFCGIAAVGLGFLADWKSRLAGPGDEGFLSYLSHANQLPSS